MIIIIIAIFIMVISFFLEKTLAMARSQMAVSITRLAYVVTQRS